MFGLVVARLLGGPLLGPCPPRVNMALHPYWASHISLRIKPMELNLFDLQENMTRIVYAVFFLRLKLGDSFKSWWKKNSNRIRIERRI